MKTKTIRVSEQAHADLLKAKTNMGMTIMGFIAFCAKKYKNKNV